jgi:hypothetical protein
MRLTTRSGPADEPVRRVPRIGAVVASAAIVAGFSLVFLLDRATASAPVQHLYYLPIIFAAVRFGLGGGVAAPAAAIVLYHLANPRLLALLREQWDVLQVALFVVVGLTTAKLTDDQRRLHLLATTDDLTGLHNLRSFETHLAAMVRACRDAGAPLTVLVLDLDRLKSLVSRHDAVGEHRSGLPRLRLTHAAAEGRRAGRGVVPGGGSRPVPGEATRRNHVCVAETAPARQDARPAASSAAAAQRET